MDGADRSAQGRLERVRRIKPPPPPDSKPDLWSVVGRVTVDAAADGAGVMARGVFLDVAIAAQRVEHRFDLQANVGVGLVAVDAQTLTAVVGEIVVAGDAIHLAMIEVRERERQQRARVEHCLTALVCRERDHRDDDAAECRNGDVPGDLHR